MELGDRSIVIALVTSIENKAESFIKGKQSFINIYRRMAENGFAPPPLGNFADISYLVENWKPSLLRDVCTLCSGALVCKSL